MEQLNSLEDTYYNNQRRQQGIARLAVHAAFEESMAKADAGQMTRENAIAHIRAVRPYILKHAGVVEVQQ